MRAALLLLCLGGSAWSLTAQAEPPPHAAVHKKPPDVHFHVSEREKLFIRSWYHRNLPPGLARQGKIPPGHAKRLARGDRWPPGVPYEPLPRELARQLQPLPEGIGYYRVGGDVVIADAVNRVVIEVAEGLLR
ncbi:MAG: hypothetical protein ACP5DC_07150 [Halothiobacillaceae bacterium]